MPLSTKLVNAAKNGDIKLIQEYLDKNGNIDELDEEGSGGLLHYAMEYHQNELAKFLLIRDADANLKGKRNAVYKLNQPTPFHKAAAFENIEGMKLLHLAAKVKVDVTDLTFTTPLHYAVSNEKEESVRFLITAGANVNARTNEGHTPLHLLIANKTKSQQAEINITQLLIYAGKADLNTKIRMDFQPHPFYSLIEFASFHRKFYLVEIIEAKQRSDLQILHTTNSQLLQKLDELIQKIEKLTNKFEQTNLIKHEKENVSNTMFGFNPKIMDNT